MTYNDIISKYLACEESYLYKREKKTLTRKDELKYYGFKMGLIDFICSFDGNYSEDKKESYIQLIKEVITPILSSDVTETSNQDELKTYYYEYNKMLDLVSIIDENDYLELSNFIRNNTIHDEREVNKSINYDKVKKRNINKLVDLVHKTHYEAYEKMIFLHIGSDVITRTKAKKNHYRVLYKTLVTAINDGLSTSDINYVDNIDYDENLMTEEEFSKYYKRPCNFVSSLSDKEKVKLKRRLRNKIERNQ